MIVLSDPELFALLLTMFVSGTLAGAGSVMLFTLGYLWKWLVKIITSISVEHDEIPRNHEVPPVSTGELNGKIRDKGKKS